MDINTTLAERGSRYGSFDEHARITQAIKRAMVDTPNWATLPDAMKESLEMAAHKMGRILNGDPNYDDSWIDIVGYTQLVINGLHGKNDSGVSVGSGVTDSSQPAPATPARAEELQADDGEDGRSGHRDSPDIELRKFLDSAAGNGFVLDGVDAADLYVRLFPNSYAEAIKPITDALNDGWIEWGGGECPVDGDTKVTVRMRDGKPEITSGASNFRWGHAGPNYRYSADYDTIAYRLAKEQA